VNTGTIIRATRVRLGMSQQDMGRLLGYERSSIANMETGRKIVAGETLAQCADKLRDTMIAAMICKECRQGGFIAGLEVPADLDRHVAELHENLHQEFKEMDQALERYLGDVREAGWEQEQQAAKRLLKQALDLLPLLVNLALALNQRGGIYHREVLGDVNHSMRRMACRRKEKEPSIKTAHQSST